MDGIAIDISVVLGGTTMPIHQLLRMGRGAVIELDTTETDDVTLYANDVPVARGQVVLRGGKVGLAVTEVLARSPARRRSDAGRTSEPKAARGKRARPA